MRDAIQEVLLWQTEYSSKSTEGMKRRGEIVRAEFVDELRGLLPELKSRTGVCDLAAQGGDGSGSRTEIPWTRIYSQSHSPSATKGWYLVFLFSAAGDRAYLSLNQGTTQWDAGGWRPQPQTDLAYRTTWARDALTAVEEFPARWSTRIRLDNHVSTLGTLYELGNVVAVDYSIDDIPTDNQIQADILTAATWLGRIYQLDDDGLYVPRNSPEVADTVTAIAAVAAPRRASRRNRLSASESKAVEQHAVDCARAHFEALGYATKDVGATESYDVHARKGGKVVKVEVKGTTSDGSDIVLTANEVSLHKLSYPDNALVIVRHIRLQRGDGSQGQMNATGGELILEFPWKVNEAGLEPIAFRYKTGL